MFDTMGNFNPDEPGSSKSGWVPTTSTVGGGVIGAAVAQVIVAVCDAYFKTPLDAATSSAVTTLCVSVAGYFIKDGGRR
jgi:hypothetical protein